MASSKIFIIIAIVTVFVPAVLATEYMVGDEKGWTINFDYQAWAQGKEFKVGDKLVFKYPQGVHNVQKVNGTAFQQCVAPAGTQTLTGGNDVITLATPGNKWYICGVGKHCEAGNQKLVITVLPQLESPASSPSPSSPPSTAMEYVVGDEKGWTMNFDYQTWAQGKEFKVGDKLVFKYPQGVHNVLKVDGTAFQQCVAPAGTQALTTGNDVITLATPGKKWYICGVGKHCEVGNQKLAITVLPQLGSPATSPTASPPAASATSPPPASAATGYNGFKYSGLMVATFVILGMVIV